MKSLDTLTLSHVKHAMRRRRATWFEEDDTEVVAPIGMLITAPARTVDESTPLPDVCRMLFENNVPAVAVVDPSAALCGVITSTDVLRGVSEEWTAADAMSSVLSVRASTSIELVAELMARENAHQVIVTDQIGQVVGIVTAHEVARHLAAR